MTLPPVPETFHWTHESWGAALRCRPLGVLATHLFTTRQLRLPEQGAWGILAAAMGADSVRRVTQVHGNRVVVHRSAARTSPSLGEARGDAEPVEGAGPLDDVRPDADAIVSDDPAVAIAVVAADCVPLLIADRRTGAVGAVHAGWRGTVARVTPATVEALAREFGSRPEELVVAIGPNIGGCCYEVGSELVDAFATAGHARHLIDRWFLATPPSRGSLRARDRGTLRLDVAGANRDQLILAGVPETQIHAAGLCTATNLDLLTSYRAERERAMRIAGVIRARVGPTSASGMLHTREPAS
ncbi:MAG: peptidoglycan editing factor PgeF [Vicinamibacterales bacterium]